MYKYVRFLSIFRLTNCFKYIVSYVPEVRWSVGKLEERNPGTLHHCGSCLLETQSLSSTEGLIKPRNFWGKAETLGSRVFTSLVGQESQAKNFLSEDIYVSSAHTSPSTFHVYNRAWLISNFEQDKLSALINMKCNVEKKIKLAGKYMSMKGYSNYSVYELLSMKARGNHRRHC